MSQPARTGAGPLCPLVAPPLRPHTATVPPWAVLYAVCALLTALALAAAGLPVVAVGLVIVEAVGLGLVLVLRRDAR